MLQRLVSSIRNSISVHLDQKKHDAALPVYFESLGIEIDEETRIEGNRFDIVRFQDREGMTGVCTYGLSGFLLIREDELVRAELCLYGDDDASPRLLELAGKHIYMSYEFPEKDRDLMLAGGECFRVLREAGLAVADQRAQKFFLLQIAAC